ncbi:MAG: trypsin-like peptidase domain-containing protein [Porticoccaceae bacterium]|nr:trypsin-like peptidase domain-containing protein [Porticoccaceae bacterium]
MSFGRIFRYLSWPVLTGLLTAALIVLLMPKVLEPPAADNNITVNELAPSSSWEGPASYASAVARAAPAVVNIYTSKSITRERQHPLLNDPFFRRFFNSGSLPQQKRMESSLGSGVIVSGSGFILTNNHVVSGADQIVILLHDGREAQATIVGVDPDTDLAVLKIDLKNLTPISIGDPQKAKVGDVTLAIGNPFGVGQSVSQGIISATGRGLGLNTFENFLQTDAAINPGNSGGALIDTYGNLLGINSAILNESSSVGLGFAIPADTAVRVMEDIVKHGRVIRGWLGVQAQQLAPDVAARLGLNPPRGLIITDIHINGPAHLAGLLPGDIITHINGQLVGDGRQGTNIIADLMPGDSIHVDVVRDGEKISVTTVAGTRPSQN